MLTALRIENLAIVERVEIGFESGLTVITGETGAGKSILVHALQLVLGGRSSGDLVRTGADRAEVEALFEIGDDPAARARLRSLDLPDDDEIVIRRSITPSGRSRATVNGALTTAAQLQQLAVGLIDISSQHQHHTLADPSTHLPTLDAYARRPELVGQVRDTFRAAAEAHEAVARLEATIRDRAEREDYLRFQVAELVKLDPKPGEIAALEEDASRLRHADRLRAATSGAEEVLYGRERSVCASLARLGADLAGVASLDPALAALSDRLDTTRVELEDLAAELGRYARRVDGDPDTLARLEDRMHALKRLAKRHGGDLDAAITFRVQAEQEIAHLADAEGALQARIADAERAAAAAYDLARQLSEVRRGAADALGKAIGRELVDLGMGGAEVM
ncbi:MAG: AAA family ATPase, partial [Myxococcota bacterium]